MPKVAKLTYCDIAAELRETSQVSMETKGSYAYATGVYESMIANLVADLPRHKQLEVIRGLESARKSMQTTA